MGEKALHAQTVEELKAASRTIADLQASVDALRGENAHSKSERLSVEAELEVCRSVLQDAQHSVKQEASKSSGRAEELESKSAELARLESKVQRDLQMSSELEVEVRTLRAALA